MIINRIIVLKRIGWVLGVMRVPFTPYGKISKSGFSNKFKKIDNIGVLMLIYVWAFFEGWEVDATMIAVIYIGKEGLAVFPLFINISAS